MAFNHFDTFWPQNALKMANTIKEWISVNFRESGRNEKNYKQFFDNFFFAFFTHI